MKIVLLLTGKTDNALFAEAIDDYQKRLSHYLPFEITVLPDLKKPVLSHDRQKAKEGELILNRLQEGDYCVLLDENGAEYTSVAFASFMEKKLSMPCKRLVFVPGERSALVRKYMTFRWKSYRLVK
jgi:23S rRNA (pseudouridine1915-N3)-methyltransferase